MAWATASRRDWSGCQHRYCTARPALAASLSTVAVATPALSQSCERSGLQRKHYGAWEQPALE